MNYNIIINVIINKYKLDVKSTPIRGNGWAFMHEFVEIDVLIMLEILVILIKIIYNLLIIELLMIF
jgi:hypothetical protein